MSVFDCNSFGSQVSAIKDNSLSNDTFSLSFEGETSFINTVALAFDPTFSSVGDVDIKLQFTDGENTVSRSLKVDPLKSLQMIKMDRVYASQVNIQVQANDFLQEKIRIVLRSILFSENSPAHAVHIVSCAASSFGRSCENMYDGLPKYWAPSSIDVNPWVKFNFLDVMTVNRVWIRHSVLKPNTSDYSVTPIKTQDYQTWEEESEPLGRSNIQFSFSQINKPTQIYTATIEHADPVSQSAEGKTVILKTTLVYEASSITMTVADPSVLIIVEIMFWFEKSAAVITQEAETHWNNRLIEIRSAVSNHIGRQASDLADVPSTTVVTTDFFQTALQTTTTGFFDWISETAQTVAMEICLGVLAVANAVLDLAKALIGGFLSVLIMALKAMIKAMGPHFFEIMNLGVGGNLDLLSGGTGQFKFDVDMWLLNTRIDYHFQTSFSMLDIIKALFGKIMDSVK